MRALLLILDSVGCGQAPDAAAYGDAGADTLGHIFAANRGLELPALFSLGLRSILFGAPTTHRRGAFGRMREVSAGKDTTSGHWEIAGAVLEEAFGVYPAFPRELTTAIEQEAGVEFIGNYPCSGTVILEQLGAEQVRSGRPILYTSADSVLQIAAHEAVVPLARLYEICTIARRHSDAYRIGRVIARPFVGEVGKFQRTGGRHDYSMVPPRTILNALAETGRAVTGIGKISDIFAGSGLTASTPTASNAEGMAAIDRLWASAGDGLLFANLVDFDALFGHRRDVAGYTCALLEFDAWLGGFLDKVKADDLVIITADHGNDPTAPGTDHTREEVPLMVLHGDRTGSLGTRTTFADIAASLAQAFALPSPWPVGTSFLPS